MAEKLSRQQRRALERKQKKESHPVRRTGYTAKEVFDIYESSENGLNLLDNSTTDFLHSESDSTKKGFWIPGELTIEIAGRKIDGLIYFGHAYPIEVQGKVHTPNHLFINPELEVAATVDDSKGTFSSEEISYDTMSPVDRANYLDWLASGKKDISYHHAYLALYFKGLEYRYFMDDSSQYEKSEIEQEIKRLILSFRVYPQAFADLINFALFIDVPAEIFDLKVQTNFSERKQIDLIEGGILLKDNKPVQSNHAYLAMSASDKTEFAEIRIRYPYVFEKLFKEKFTKLHPDGLKGTIPKEFLPCTYRSLSGDFTFVKPIKYLGEKVPDISFCKEIKNATDDIGKTIAVELADYCHEIEQSIENFFDQNQIVFPIENNRNLSKYPADELVKDWIVEQNKKTEDFIAKDVAEFLSYNPDIHFEVKPWYQLVAMLERVGYGIAPDFGLFNCRTDPNNPMVIYQLKSPLADRAKCSNLYNSEFLAIFAGITLFRSKKKFTGKQLKIIEDQIDIENKLTAYEKERLLANFEWFQKNLIGNNYVSQINTFVRSENSEKLRESIKYFVEKGNLNIVEKLQTIVGLYISLGIDIEHVEADFKLTNEIRVELLAIAQRFEKSVEDVLAIEK